MKESGKVEGGTKRFIVLEIIETNVLRIEVVLNFFNLTTKGCWESDNCVLRAMQSFGGDFWFDTYYVGIFKKERAETLLRWTSKSRESVRVLYYLNCIQKGKREVANVNIKHRFEEMLYFDTSAEFHSIERSRKLSSFGSI